MPKIQMRRDTSANWKSVNPTLSAGEWALETDTQKMKIGDGTAAYNSLAYFREEDNAWQKPASWMDIRSGALDNSVYFLVGHSADYATYPKIIFTASVSDSGTYDILIDGVKQASSVASATATTFVWQTLALTTGYDVTYPENLRTHIVRVCPTDKTKTLSAIKVSADSGVSAQIGLLWAHFTTKTAISLRAFASSTGSTGYRFPVFEAVTCDDNELKVNDLYQAFFRNKALKEIPTINAQGNTSAVGVFAESSLKKVKLKNFNPTAAGNTFGNSSLEKIETENSIIPLGATFGTCQNLTRLPAFTSVGAGETIACNNMPRLQETLLDLSDFTGVKKIQAQGTSTYPNIGIKGLVVSPFAPFDGTSPQINVSYTGLNRIALVNLFESMPYNVGYEVEGSPTIEDGVASDVGSSNYLKLSQTFNPAAYTSWEIVIKAKRPDTNIRGIFCIGTGGYSLGVRFGKYDSDYLLQARSYQSSTVRLELSSGIGSDGQANTYYYVKVRKNNNTYYLSYSLDGQSFVNEVSAEPEGDIPSGIPILGRAVFLGASLNGGSIDLNESYIKVNGLPYFTGATAMTKTCSVVGCTGTADLTADDKNIALDKGWELTVA